MTPAEKSKKLLTLHQGPRLLILPNIWDVSGARLLESLGYPAVATASAAVAWSEGIDDGERISFDRMLQIVESIVRSVDLPVTADLESGFARTPDALARTMGRALATGIAGVNLEDTDHATGKLFSVEEQVERLRVARSVAESEGVHLVLNARTDVFLHAGGELTPERMTEATRRCLAYLEAGADCLYPILLSDLQALAALRKDTGAPINVYASASTPSIAELESVGIARLSLGPGLFKASLGAMKGVAETLLAGGSYASFTEDAPTSPEVKHHLLRN